MPQAYIETTVPSYYVARPSNRLSQAARQASTRKWWDEGCSGLELVTSLETLDEAAQGDQTVAAARLNLLHHVPLLTMNETAIALSTELIQSEIIPKKAASDAIHIAIATVHQIDYLVTWNFKHIANPFLRDRLQTTVSNLGFRLPTMCSPEELLENDEDY